MIYAKFLLVITVNKALDLFPFLLDYYIFNKAFPTRHDTTKDLVHRLGQIFIQSKTNGTRCIIFFQEKGIALLSSSKNHGRIVWLNPGLTRRFSYSTQRFG